MSQQNGAAPAPPPLDGRAFARELLVQGARLVGCGSIGWDQIVLPRVDKSGPLGGHPLEAHLAEIRRDALAAATRAVRVAVGHPAIVHAVDVDRGLACRQQLQLVAGHAAAIEHALRRIEELQAD